MPDNPLLRSILQLAVPLWIAELQAKPWSYVADRVKVCGQYVAEHGDMIQFKTKDKTAEAFNRLAEGVACLSFVPGGVTFMGDHWEAEHPKDA